MERLHVVVSAGLALALAAMPGYSHAQSTGSTPEGARTDTANDETIVVTGSLVELDNLTSLGPVTVITADEIAASGAITIDSLLHRLPSVTAQGVARSQSSDSKDPAFIELRNLGVQRPLILVNGRRFVASGTGVSEAVDLNNIPVAMVQRIEVLMEGAPAIYGADAIAGVINIILKDSVQGLILDASTGITDEGDSETLHLTGTTGQSTDRGNVSANVSYLYRGDIAQRDRDWARNPVVFAEFANGMDSDNGITDLVGSSAVPAGRSGDIVFIPDPGTGASFRPFAPGDRYNHGLRQSLAGTQQRWSTTVLGRYDLVDKKNRGSVLLRDVDLYVEGTYTHHLSQDQRAPEALGLAGTSIFPAGFLVPTTNPYIPDDFRATLDPSTLAIPLARTLIELGDRLTSIDADTFRVVTGVRGLLLRNMGKKGEESEPLPMSYRWDVYLDYGRSRSQQTTLNAVDFARVLETVDPGLCAANAARGCVVGDYFGQGSLTQDVVDYIRYTDVEHTSYDQLVLGASASSDLYSIPAGGMLRSGAGYAFRSEGGFHRPSPTTARGDAATSTRDLVAGSYNSHDVFAEVNAPIFRKTRHAHELTLDVAGRWSHYNKGFGSKGIYRAALSYAPIPDIRLRSSYSTAFRVPGISQLFGGTAETLVAAQDPCHGWDTNPVIDPVVRENCMQAGVPAGFDQRLISDSRLRTNVGGNPNLDPETAGLFHVGLVFWPRFIENLSVTADYYRIRIDGAITNPDPQTILDDCYESLDLSSPSCAAIERGATGSITRIDAFARNIDQVTTSGIDVTLSYVRALDEQTRLDVALQGNLLLDYSEEMAGSEHELGGTIAWNRGSLTHVRMAARASVVRGNWSVANVWRFIGSAQVAGVEPGTRPHDRVPAVIYWDVTGMYRASPWSVMLGVNNLMDRDPPFFLDGSQNANTQTYHIVGRYFFTRIGYEF